MNSAIHSLGVRQNSQNAKPLGVVVIGCGYWGMNYVRIFNELVESRVVAVCDQSAERLREVSRRFPGVYLTTQVDDAASQPGVDAVVVCTEATTHFNVTRQLLLSGRHVLVEKPLTTTGEDAEKLIDLAETNSAILMVGHTFVFNAGSSQSKGVRPARRRPSLLFVRAKDKSRPHSPRRQCSLGPGAPTAAIFNYAS